MKIIPVYDANQKKIAAIILRDKIKIISDSKRTRAMLKNMLDGARMSKNEAKWFAQIPARFSNLSRIIFGGSYDRNLTDEEIQWRLKSA